MPSGSGRQFAGAHFEDKRQFAGVDFKREIHPQLAVRLVVPLDFLVRNSFAGTHD
jgi:hypothetical protein